MAIRHAELEDAPALARVMVDSFMAGHAGQMPEEAWRKRREEWSYAKSEAGWARTLREINEGALPRTCVYVASDEAVETEAAGSVVGLVMAGPAESAKATGEIYALYVLPRSQGRGHGRALVQAAAAYLARMGMPTLQIGCLAANAPARGFYESLGGRVVEERLFDEEGILLPEPIYGWADTQSLIAAGSAIPNEP